MNWANQSSCAENLEFVRVPELKEREKGERKKKEKRQTMERKEGGRLLLA